MSQTGGSQSWLCTDIPERSTNGIKARFHMDSPPAHVTAYWTYCPTRLSKKTNCVTDENLESSSSFELKWTVDTHIKTDGTQSSKFFIILEVKLSVICRLNSTTSSAHRHTKNESRPSNAHSKHVLRVLVTFNFQTMPHLFNWHAFFFYWDNCRCSCGNSCNRERFHLVSTWSTKLVRTCPRRTDDNTQNFRTVLSAIKIKQHESSTWHWSNDQVELVTPSSKTVCAAQCPDIPRDTSSWSV